MTSAATRREEESPVVRHLEDGDGTTIVVDFGPSHTELDTDIVDDTLIVIDEADEQYELDIPAGEASTFMRNGVLTIEVEE